MPRYTAEQIKGEAKRKIFLNTLAGILNPAFKEETLDAIMTDLRQLEKQDPANIRYNAIMILYIMAVKKIPVEELDHRYQTIPGERSDLIMTLAEELRQEGKREGRQEGRQEGIVMGKVEIARNMLKLNLDITTIEQATGLSPEEIKQLMQ